jgi:glyoxylase-like metal-dependent hydrolase (beta-lactamase superfamily II)
MRCLLIESGNKLILVDTGMGNKQDDKFFGYYYLHGNDSIESNLNKYGFTTSDITDVVLTHLHFDHCGGAIQYNASRTGYEPAFKNAHYYSHSKHWDWAMNPNAREKASFLKENILPIQESGQLKFIDLMKEHLLPELNFINVYGHTEAMQLPIIKYKNTTIAYMADLIPSAAHLPLPYVMGYDMRPLETLKEKKEVLEKAVEQNWLLYFEHDAQIECASLERTEKGIRMKNQFLVKDL